MATPTPLNIAVHSTFEGTFWVGQLRALGHVVTILPPSFEDFNLVLAPMCARFLPGMEAFLDALIKGARKVKYPKKDKG